MGSKLSSKAETLDYLRNTFKKNNIIIDDLYIFTVRDWESNSDLILNEVELLFTENEILIVRSSALDEDIPAQSRAGFFKTIMNVNGKSRHEIIKAIEYVIASYSKDSRLTHPLDQVIVQAQLIDALLSGVLFTIDLRLRAPYYVVNFDDTTGKTDTVTRGLSGKTLRIAQWVDPNNLPRPWREIILASKEIEKLFPDSSLSLEFGVDGNDFVHIFQSRFLERDQTLSKSNDSIGELQIRNEVINLQNQVQEILNQSNKQILKTPSSLTDMSDWNPAEILGGRPNLLDISIYRYLVTQSAWNTARASLGYTDVAPYELMVSVGNKPYIDTKVSFRSLTPDNIAPDLKDRLLVYYLDKLLKKPELQDKVEFEIVFSCFDFNFKHREQELILNGFSHSNISKVKKDLLFFTNNLLENSEIILKKDLSSVQELQSASCDTSGILTFHDGIDKMFLSLSSCRD